MASVIYFGRAVIASPETEKNLAVKIFICSRYQSQNPSDLKIASDNVEEIVISSAGNISMLSSSTLQKIWSTDLGGASVSSMLLNRNSIYLITYFNHPLLKEKTNGENTSETVNTANSETFYLQALDRASGLTRWQTKLEFPETSSLQNRYLFNYEDFLILISDSGKISSFIKENGQKIWEKDLETQLSSPPSVLDDKIILGTLNHQIISFSLKDNRPDKVLSVNSPPTIITKNSKGNLIVGDKRGAISFIDSKRKFAAKRFRSGAEISSINETNAGLLVTSLDNFVYMLSKTSGELIWKKRLAGRISAAPLITDSFFIVSPIESSDAGIFELRTGKLLNQISIERDNFFTNQSIQIGNLVFYTTLQSVVSFSLTENGCPFNAKRADGSIRQPASQNF